MGIVGGGGGGSRHGLNFDQRRIIGFGPILVLTNGGGRGLVYYVLVISYSLVCD